MCSPRLTFEFQMQKSTLLGHILLYLWSPLQSEPHLHLRKDTEELLEALHLRVSSPGRQAAQEAAQLASSGAIERRC